MTYRYIKGYLVKYDPYTDEYCYKGKWFSSEDLDDIKQEMEKHEAEYEDYLDGKREELS